MVQSEIHQLQLHARSCHCCIRIVAGVMPLQRRVREQGVSVGGSTLTWYMRQTLCSTLLPNRHPLHMFVRSDRSKAVESNAFKRSRAL